MKDQSMNTVEIPHLITTKEASEILHVTPRSVSRFAAEGKIASYKQEDGHLAFKESDIRSLARSRAALKSAANQSSKTAQDPEQRSSTSDLTVSQTISQLKREIKSAEQQVQDLQRDLMEKKRVLSYLLKLSKR
ncbi:hypothetical protein Bang102_004395 [Bifidobacterium angulatum]|nr:hypothetical protein Bang102_004395 [Bifidobacterium angulatum]MEE0332390.1 helix-turn-helix domain-containing protein [Bifidobacterium angulatum]